MQYLFCMVKIRVSKIILTVKGKASNISGPFNGPGNDVLTSVQAYNNGKDTRI